MKRRKNNSKGREISTNTIYTIAGTLVLNAVLQLILYPRMTRDMGSERMGTVLFVMGLVAILSPSIGQSLNNGRLVLRRDHEVSNGDYFFAVLIISLISLAVVLPFTVGSIGGPAAILPSAVLILLTSYRYYGDVEYRLSLQYRKFFFYYLAASVGYLSGYFIYRVTGSWYWAFLTGEIFALVYVSLTGSVFKGFLTRSQNFRLVMGKGTLLVSSYLITNTTLNMDRLILKSMVGGEAVTIYYVASLIGKTLVLLVAPINTIIISYLTKEKVRLSRGQFLRYSGAGLLVSLFFLILCQIGTPLFVRLFYRDLTAGVAPLVTIVNLTQILAVLSAYLFMLVLTFADERWQLILQALHLGVMMAMAIPMTLKSGLMGFSLAVMIANILRIAAVLCLGLVKLSGKRR